MKPGRPPSWLLDASQPSPVAQETATIDDDGRLVVPARIRSGVEWLPGEALGILEEHGRVRLADWAATSPAVLSHRKMLLAQLDDESEDDRGALLSSLRGLDDRYCRLNVGKNGRVRLHDGLRLHLSKELRVLVVVRLVDEIELWSPEYRDERNVHIRREFDALP